MTLARRIAKGLAEQGVYCIGALAEEHYYEETLTDILETVLEEIARQDAAETGGMFKRIRRGE